MYEKEEAAEALETQADALEREAEALDRSGQWEAAAACYVTLRRLYSEAGRLRDGLPGRAFRGHK